LVTVNWHNGISQVKGMFPLKNLGPDLCHSKTGEATVYNERNET